MWPIGGPTLVDGGVRSRLLRYEREEPAWVVHLNGVQRLIAHAGLPELLHEHRDLVVIPARVAGQEQVIHVPSLEEREDQGDAVVVSLRLAPDAIDANEGATLGERRQEVRIAPGK